MTEPSKWAQRAAVEACRNPDHDPLINLAAALDAAWRKGIEEAAQAAETFFPRAHTHASENAGIYHAQDDAQRGIAARIRALADKEPTP